MKTYFSRMLLTVSLAGVVLLGAGCNDDMKTAMWWFGSPWSPVVFSGSGATDGGGAGGTGGTGGDTGGGGNTGNGGYNAGGGYNVGGGVPGVGF